MTLAAFGTVLACGSIAPDCIDDGDYLHWVGSVAVVGSHAYVANGASGLYVIEITNPESPVAHSASQLKQEWGLP